LPSLSFLNFPLWTWIQEAIWCEEILSCMECTVMLYLLWQCSRNYWCCADVLNEGMDKPVFVLGFLEERIFKQFWGRRTFRWIFLQAILYHSSEAFSVALKYK
jgi:hypothetical protein